MLLDLGARNYNLDVFFSDEALDGLTSGSDSESESEVREITAAAADPDPNHRMEKRISTDIDSWSDRAEPRLGAAVPTPAASSSQVC